MLYGVMKTIIKGKEESRFMKSTLKKVIVVIACLVLVTSNSLFLFAASYSKSIDVTSSKATATFTYGSGGVLLENKLSYTERHSQTGQVYSSTEYNYVNGSKTSVTTTKIADTGYNMLYAQAKLYIGGSSTAYDQTPVTYAD